MFGFQISHHDQTGNLLCILEPVNLNFFISARNDEIGHITYDIPKESGLANPTFTVPKRTNYRLTYQDRILQVGIHTVAETSKSDEMLHVSGKDWLCYLEGRHWFFDPSDPDGNLYRVVNRPRILVLIDILDNVRNRPNSVNFVHNTANLSSGNNQNYRIDAADTESIHSKLNTLGEQDPRFWMKCYPPNPLVHPVGTLFELDINPFPGVNLSNSVVLDEGVNVYNVVQRLEGPVATEVLVLGQGSAHRQGTIRASVLQDEYSLWQTSVDVGQVKDAAMLSRLADKANDDLGHNVEMFTCEARDIPLVNASGIVGSWSKLDVLNLATPGDIIRLRAEPGYDSIPTDRELYVVSYEGGNEGGGYQVRIALDETV